jgi:hypothetical protein
MDYRTALWSGLTGLLTVLAVLNELLETFLGIVLSGAVAAVRA